MRLKDKLIIWVYKQTDRLESETESLKFQRKFETMDALDIYENMRATIRIAAWKEFINDLFKILINCDIDK